MSDCRNSTGYDVLKLRIDFAGQEFPWMYPLALNGREVEAVYIGGVLYEPAEDMLEVHNGRVDAIVRDGVRYVRAPEIDYDVTEVD